MTRILALLTLLLSGCTTTVQEQLNVSAETAFDLSTERLLAEPPPGWHRIYQLNTDTTRISDFVPADEDEENWRTRISFESLLARNISTDPISILIDEAETDKSRCDFVQHFNIHSGYENGYEASVRLYLCGENAFTRQGEIKLVKAIKGQAYIYFIRILHRQPPFDVNEPDLSNEVVGAWSTYLKKISLCDDSASHACPADNSQ